MRDDPYLQGFAEGRRSMARSIAVKLAGTMSDEEIEEYIDLIPVLENLKMDKEAFLKPVTQQAPPTAKWRSS